MPLKWIGAILVVAGCGGLGFSLAMNYRREEKTLRQLLNILEFMECELEFRLSALPQLCREGAEHASGSVRQIFLALAEELEMQVCPDAVCCMDMALRKAKELPASARKLMLLLGQSLGRFDLKGQLSELASVKAACREALDELLCHRETRIRNYQTLGLCAGAALAILLI